MSSFGLFSCCVSCLGLPDAPDAAAVGFAPYFEFEIGFLGVWFSRRSKSTPSYLHSRCANRGSPILPYCSHCIFYRSVVTTYFTVMQSLTILPKFSHYIFDPTAVATYFTVVQSLHILPYCSRYIFYRSAVTACFTVLQ